MIRRIGTLLWIGLMAANTAQAGGLYVSELSTSSQGNAGAGRGAWVDDASVTLHSPASMTELDDHAFSLGLSALGGSVRFEADPTSPSGGPDGGNQVGFTPLASLNYAHHITDRLRFGFTTFSISGSVLDPEDDWAGRYEMTEIALITLSFSPTLAYRVTDWLSIGGGPIATFGRLNWNLATDVGAPTDRELKLKDLSDWAAAGRLGILLKPTDNLSISANWTSKTDFKLDGDLRLPSGVTAALSSTLALAQYVEVSAAWRVTEPLELLLTFDWEDWSQANELSLVVGPRPVDATTGFKDTYKIGVGANYRVSDRWLLQSGFMYDSSALDDKDRTTALPVDRQLRGSVGLRYDWSDALTTGLNFTYVNLGRGAVRNPSVSGEYRDNHLFVVGLTFDFKRVWWSKRS